jgi:sensor histidine kinase YesM
MPLILLPIVVGLYVVSDQYEQAIRDQTEANTRRLLDIAVERLDQQFARFEEISLKFFVDTEIHALMGRESSDYYERVLTQQQLERGVNRLLAGPERQYMPVSLIVSKDGRTYTVGSRTHVQPDSAFIGRMREAEGGAVWELGNYEPSSPLNGRLIMGRTINELEKFSLVGQIIFAIEPEAFLSIWNETVKDEGISFHITAADGSTLLSSGDAAASAAGSYLTLPIKSKLYDWTLTARVPLMLLDRVAAQTRIFTVVVALLCVLIGLGVTRIFVVDIIDPIRKLMVNMKRGIMGIAPEQLERVKGALEIRELNDTFISVMYEIRLLNTEVLKTNQRKQEAQIKALVNQLSPHFLYNTLNSIRWMAMIHQQDNIREMTDSLISLMSYSVRDISKLVPLKQELDILHDYVKIQKVRYQNFAMATEVDEAFHHVPIPKFVLQPLVENAILHGLEPSPRGGRIEVHAELAGRDLLLTVSDNGVGMDEARVHFVRAQMESEEPGHHVGLRNIRERIQLYFGRQYGVAIASEPGVGTSVSIKLPLPDSTRGEIAACAQS